MYIGFTGTRKGMSEPQQESVRALLDAFKRKHWDEDIVGIHGDCVGADADFDAICNSLDIETWCYPSTLSNNRAYTSAPPLADPEHPLARNRYIVQHVDFMIACALTIQEQKRSGTWFTVRYARQSQKNIYLVLPFGSIELETPTSIDYFKIGDIYNANADT